VIRETGVIGDYRWGPVRKRAMMAWESAPRIGVETPGPHASFDASSRGIGRH
jgi:AraC family transcriptional regulator of adaptative response/methylated-DNA-[protein]-cysteine methyltransferase